MTLDLTVLMAPLLWGLTAALLVGALAIVLGGLREGTGLPGTVGHRRARDRHAGRWGLPASIRSRAASPRNSAVFS